MLSMSDVACFIPSRRLNLEEIGESLGLDELQIKVYKKMHGLEKIPTAEGIEPIEFFKNPVQLLLHKNKIDPRDIKFLIHAHTGKVNIPFGDSIVRRIKNELKLKNAVSFGTTINNCASALVAFDMLSCLLNKNRDEQAIIICGDIAFTRVLQLIPKTSVLGDASVAMLVNKQNSNNQLLSFDYHIEGKYAKGIWMEEEGKLFEKHYAEFLSKSIMRAVKKAGISLDQIKLILPHNVNLLSWQRVANCLDVSIEKIYLKNIKHYSHCFGADPFINYMTALQEGMLKPGDYYLLATVGLGAVFASAVFRY